ncbi:serine--tRNA ligase, partial [Candidatus Woesearchaeota archaeon]|nr:serine--tRNA ligase [Candidatus Woesearchaeota archaeon]
MLDINLIRNKPEIIEKDLRKRDMREKIKDLEKLRELDRNWRDAKQESEKLRHQRNVVSREIAQLKKQGKDISAKIKIAKDLPAKIEKSDEKRDMLRKEMNEILMRLPNILHESVPVGVDDTDNVVVKKYGKKTKKDFEIKSHVDILEKQDFADTEKAAEVSGSRFYYLKRELVLLDLALMRYAMDILHKKGFILMEPPFMMRREPYEGVTSLDDFKDVMYKIEDEDLYLIATSEHPIAAYHLDDVIDEDKLPLKYAGLSPCFRKEAGSHGKDTKGIFRVHHFNKIEQFIFSKPEDSWKFHEEMIKNAEEVVKGLELPFRIVNVCTGDIGTIAAKKYDLEVWMPVQNKYRELISCS